MIDTGYHGTDTNMISSLSLKQGLDIQKKTPKILTCDGNVFESYIKIKVASVYET